jgi:transposase-like protein
MCDASRWLTRIGIRCKVAECRIMTAMARTGTVEVKGKWTYLYRAVDKIGRTVDFYLSEKRDVSAAKHFFRKAMNSVGPPRVITFDAYAASHRASNGSTARQ